MGEMRGGFAFSVGVHVLILALLIFGLPYFHRKAPDQAPTISVELIDTSKETTTNKISDANKVQKQPDEEKPAPPTPPPPQAQPTPQPQQQPEPQPKPTFEDAPKLAAAEDSVPDLKAPELDIRRPLPDAPKLAAVDTSVPELAQPKLDLKKVQPKPPAEDPFKSLLKNLTKDIPQQPTDQPPNPQVKTPPKPATGAQAPLATNLTASEMDALKNQLRQCWSLPAAAKDAQDLAVDIDISVNPDRTVASAQVDDQGRMSDPVFRAAAMSALRALRMPQCTPLALPPDKYQEWQSMTVRFDPKEMLGQ
jgi:outer membrane biosynthesis protein TonB